MQSNASLMKFEKELWERIRRECKSTESAQLCSYPEYPKMLKGDFSRYPLFSYRVLTLSIPELRIYTFWERLIGPRPVAMFEVNLFTPA